MEFMDLESFFDDGEKKKKNLNQVKETKQNQRKNPDGKKHLLGEQEFSEELGLVVGLSQENEIYLDGTLLKTGKKLMQRMVILKNIKAMKILSRIQKIKRKLRITKVLEIILMPPIKPCMMKN